MEPRPLLSVIVPVYKVEQYLPRCVASILGQTYDNLEILLVDDGSPDSCGALCDGYAASDPRVKVIHKENGGLSSARNAGLDAASGEFLAFVDSDDWIEPDAYEAMLSAAERYQARLVCAGRYDEDAASGEHTLGLCPEREEALTAKELLGRIFLWDNCDFAVPDKLFGRELFENWRFPEGKVCEDVAIMYRVLLQAERAVLLPKPIYHYFHRAGSITTSAVSEKTFHFSAHTAVIYPYIRETCPEIAPQARYFRVKSLMYDLLSLENAGKEGRKPYRDQYASSRKALREHVSFLFTSPYFGGQERLTGLLLAAGLYRPLRALYHGGKF